MKNRHIGYGKPPGRHWPGELLDGPPPGTPPGLDEDERRHALLFMLEDLEEDRLKIQQARREWTRAFDAIRDPVFIHDANYRVVRANRAYAERAKSDFTGVIGRPYWEVFPRRSGPLPRCQIATEDKHDCVTEEFTLDSGEIFVSRAFVIRDTDRHFLYAVHVLEDVTEQRRAETERRLLSEALRQSAAGLILLNSDLSFRYANPAACELVGYGPGRLDGLPISAVVPEGMHERTPAIKAAVDATGLWTGEVTLAARDGTPIPAYLSASIIADANGKPLAYVGSWLDLRPIRQAQEALAASEARFRLLTENASDLVAVVDPAGKVLYISQSIQRQLGYTPDEVIGHGMSDFLHPEDIAAAQAKIARSIAELSATQEMTHRLRHKDGSWRYFETLGRNLLHEPAVGGIVLNSRDITERRRVEQALAESEEKFRSISATALDAVLMIDNDGRLLYWNPAAERIFGYRAEEALGRFLHELLAPPRYHADIERGFASFRESGTGPVIGKTLELEALRKDGSEFPIELSISALRLNDRWHAVGILRDISARRRTAEELRRQRDTAHRYLDIAGVMLVALDSAGNVTLINRKGCELLGYREEEVVGQSWFDRFLPDRFRKDTRGVFERIVTGETQLTEFYENPVLAHSGAERMIAWHNRALTDETGKIIGTLSSGEDITERKQAEEALRESEEKFRALVETTTDWIWQVNEHGVYTYASPQVRSILGYEPEEIIGKTPFDLMLPSEIGRIEEIFKSVVVSRKPFFLLENTNLHKDGRTIVLETSGTPLFDETGAYRGCRGIDRDITARKQMEEALRRSNRALKSLSAGNAVLVHAGNEPALLEQICRVIVEFGGYLMAWVGYAAPGGTGIVRPVAGAGSDNGEIETFYLAWEGGTADWGLTDRIFPGELPAIVRNIRTNPGYLSLREGARRGGYDSFVALPLRKEHEPPFGALYIYAAESNAFDEEEVRLLAEMADDLAFGILVLRTRAEHQRLQEEHLKTAERLKETLTDTIRAIALTVEKRDPYTAGHQHKVADLCVAIGGELGLPEDRIEGMRLGATIHDIGKVYVPAEILNRPGKLSDAEFAIIKSHPEVGYEIIKDVKFPWPVAETIRQHHEHLDGSGYPRGLKGEAVLLEARILMVADVVEAMASHRPYRPARGIEAALEEIERHRGEWYDPAVVDACLRLFREKRFAFG